ncbi:hypothetical protein F-LCD7_0499 [Faustovirus]|nr:hypothetical protein F-LCD7_0499 [Faustovirus]
MALKLIVTTEERHTIATLRTEDNGAIGIWWQTVYNVRDGLLTSIHRTIAGRPHGLTEVFDDGIRVAEIVYIAGCYRRMRTYENRIDGARAVIFDHYACRAIDVTEMCV